jgi:hypothetical protein
MGEGLGLLTARLLMRLLFGVVYASLLVAHERLDVVLPTDPEWTVAKYQMRLWELRAQGRSPRA